MKPKPILTLMLLFLGISLGREAQAFYNPTTGRWLSRDPIQEKGGRNLFGFVHNDDDKLDDQLVFAHELGHVLLDSGGHDFPPSNLMSGLMNRTPGADKLTPSQCDRMRKFPLLRSLNL